MIIPHHTAFYENVLMMGFVFSNLLLVDFLNVSKAEISYNSG